jgi:hypothetical protein
MGIELEEGENPVVREIRRRIQWDLGDLTIERLVVKYGSSFKGIERPKGYRLRAEKQCYMNSFCLADAGHGDAHRGFYVEGFVLRGDHLFQHAWVTPDGRHAIDVTLRGPASENHFFGIPFSHKILLAEACGREKRACFPLLQWLYPTESEALLQKAVVSPPECRGMRTRARRWRWDSFHASIHSAQTGRKLSKCERLFGISVPGRCY